MSVANQDQAEVNKFNELASRWWDPDSEFKPLHRINPLRVDYIAGRLPLSDCQLLDVGCGGGLLAEGLAAHGAAVTGIDLAPASIEVAKLHLLESGLKIDYRVTSADDLLQDMPEAFDTVTCLEVLEHVPDPAQLVATLAGLVKPGGDVILSTLNRNTKSFLGAIVGAEYLLGLVPKGTHEYERFIKPSELNRWARAAGLELVDLAGISYDPLGDKFSLGDDVDINYLAHFRRSQ